MRLLEVIIKEDTWLFKDQRHKETNQKKNRQHDNTLGISAQISSLLSSTSVLSVRFRWDMVVMSFYTYVMLVLASFIKTIINPKIHKLNNIKLG